jgi:hypothetical protein
MMSGYALETPVLQVFTVLQAWLMSVTGLDISHVIQGRQNGVPAPPGLYINMTQTGQKSLSMFDTSYNVMGGTESVNNSFDVIIQCDCYGVGAGDLASAISTLFGTEPGCNFFDAYTVANGFSTMEPLYSDDPQSMAFTNEEQQYESRYIVKVHINVTTGVTIPMQFMASAKIGTIVNVSTTPR